MEKRKSQLLQKIIQGVQQLLSIHNHRQSILHGKLRAHFLDVSLGIKPIKLYWQAYGGSKAFLLSPYLWAAVLFSIVTAPAWLEIDKDGVRTWAQLPLSILPNILGFSMGGMAIMLAFAGSKVFVYITEDGKAHSYFIKIIAAFYHFIFAQTIALFMGLLCRTYSFVVFSFIGYVAMCYAMLVALATAAQLFNTARIANLSASLPDPAVQIDEGPNQEHNKSEC